METPNIPIEKACEPMEEAKQSRVDVSPRSKRLSSRHHKSIVDDIESIENSLSQKSNIALSQPGTGLSHRDKLAWLLRRHAPGLWARCDECARWRHLPHVLDAHDLPDKWYCRMNPDPQFSSCEAAESALRVRQEEDLIHGEYSAGSLVWARLAGWPRWPALVDLCPDTEQYYWLDGFSDIPTHYNVTFFDTAEVTRAWITPDHLEPYNKTTFKIGNKQMRYKKRIQASMAQADDAKKLPVSERLMKYSFTTRYKGSINTPKKIGKKDLIKHQKSLKRKFNIEFSIEIDSDSDGEVEKEVEESPKKRNVILLGTPKSNKNKQVSKIVAADSTCNTINNNDSAVAKTLHKDASKQANSMAVQVGSTAESSVTQDNIDDGI